VTRITKNYNRTVTKVKLHNGVAHRQVFDGCYMFSNNWWSQILVILAGFVRLTVVYNIVYDIDMRFLCRTVRVMVFKVPLITA